jgi:sugar lactone lactonase YvrE
VAVGPDGAVYVGLLRGVPSDPGTAEIYRLVPGHKPVIWARGLTSIAAIAFDRQGRLLATELNTGGLLSPPNVPGDRQDHRAVVTSVISLPVRG